MGGCMNDIKAIAKFVVALRKDQGLTQKEVSGLCNVGVRFISDLENGKPTVHMGKALHIIRSLGGDIQLIRRKA